MLIRLLRKIAGLRAADFYLTRWEKGGGQGRAEEVLRGPKISAAEAVFANVIQMPVFP